MTFVEARGQAEPRLDRPAISRQDAARVGVLLVNLGTPDATDYRSVRRYLSEFLSDRRVIEASPLIWQPILQGVVLSIRPFRSGANYKRIWNRTLGESPLRTFTRGQSAMLARSMRGDPAAADGPLVVDWAMRYGQPSIADRLDHLTRVERCERILVVPLYPQYSATTTATVNDEAFRALIGMRRQPAIRTVPSFPDHPLYIEALAQSVRDTLASLAWTPDLILASFHGLPRRYVKKGDPYPSECNRTMRALRAALGLKLREMPMTFQSRFGREPWLVPYTDERVALLRARGVRKLLVVTPGFLADCIETLDEIGVELRHQFMAAGGEAFATVPCLNDSRLVLPLLDSLVRDGVAGWV